MKNKKTLYIVLLAVFSVIFIVSAMVLAVKLWPEKNDFDKYKNHSSSVPSENSSKELPENPINFAELKAQNEDVCGYIKIDGTAVDYPVMRSGEGYHDDYYLDHDWLKNSKFAGSIYMQKLNDGDFSDPCTVLYGHNMKNGSMFAGIRKYRNRDFFEANRYINIYTPGHALKYEIVSAFTYDDRHLLNSFDFNSESGFNHFTSECMNPKSLQSYNVYSGEQPVYGKDKLLVLSTCTDGYDDQRYLVVGKLIEDIETK